MTQWGGTRSENVFSGPSDLRNQADLFKQAFGFYCCVSVWNWCGWNIKTAHSASQSTYARVLLHRVGQPSPGPQPAAALDATLSCLGIPSIFCFLSALNVASSVPQFWQLNEGSFTELTLDYKWTPTRNRHSKISSHRMAPIVLQMPLHV